MQKCLQNYENYEIYEMQELSISTSLDKWNSFYDSLDEIRTDEKNQKKKTNNSTNTAKSYECIICLDNISNDKMYITECIHHFDIDYIYTLVIRNVGTNILCPTCKTPVNSQNIIDTYNNKNNKNKWIDMPNTGIINKLIDVGQSQTDIST